MAVSVTPKITHDLKFGPIELSVKEKKNGQYPDLDCIYSIAVLYYRYLFSFKASVKNSPRKSEEFHFLFF